MRKTPARDRLALLTFSNGIDGGDGRWESRGWRLRWRMQDGGTTSVGMGGGDFKVLHIMEQEGLQAKQAAVLNSLTQQF